MIALLMGGCDVSEETVNFKPVRFADLPGWEDDDHAAALGALLKSCRKMKEPDEGCAAALVLGDGIDRAAARQFFETHYVPHAIEGGNPKGFVTGYYEPEVDGARARGGKFTVPVYRRPDDLVTLKSDDERARFNNSITGMRETADGPKPYYTRAEIDGGALSGRGLELLYLDDPVELFFLQVQGSGRVRLADGSIGAPRLRRQERASLYLDRQAPGRDGRRRACRPHHGRRQGLAPRRSRTGAEFDA